MTLLKSYAQQELLWNATVNGTTTDAGLDAYRGELIIIDGKISETSGAKGTPEVLLKQVALLADAEKIQFIAGCFEELEHLPAFLEKYGADFAPTCQTIFYVENLGKELKVEIAGVTAIVLPIEDSMVWNELMDVLGLDKTDFKRKTAEDKVVVLYEGLQDYDPRYPLTAWDEALTHTIEVKKLQFGAV